jgi:hypothetical protein
VSVSWRKAGQVFQADAQRPWMRSHTAVPTPLALDDARVRIYFGTRDADQRPHVGWLDVELGDTPRVLALATEPALGPGPPGHFDDNGVYPGPVVWRDGRLWMYYLGRSNGSPPLFYMAIGLAVSDDGGITFQRARQAPLLARGEADPWMVTTPFVLVEGDRWRMWYVSGLGWDFDRTPPRSYYHVKYAESADGLDWRRDGTVCIDFDGDETNIASPTVLPRADGYDMWYSRYADGYALGYATSADGIAWERRDDDAGISPGPEAWDAEGMAYPSAFVHAGRRYLLYSGNGYGAGGMGLAVEDD